VRLYTALSDAAVLPNGSTTGTSRVGDGRFCTVPTGFDRRLGATLLGSTRHGRAAACFRSTYHRGDERRGHASVTTVTVGGRKESCAGGDATPGPFVCDLSLA
jgi:hypothetical protein